MKKRKKGKSDKWFYEVDKPKRRSMAKAAEEPKNDVAIAKRERVSLAHVVAAKYSMEGDILIRTLRESIFPVHKDGSPATDTEMIAFLAIAHEHNMNPFIGEIYPYIAQTGAIKTIISVDGWLRKINESPAFNGMTFEDKLDDKGKLSSVTITIFRKDREHPTVVTEYMAECYRDTPPWKQMPYRMLRHKAVRQGARYAFGFASTFDEDYFDTIHVGSGSSAEVIANATASRAQKLKEKLAGATAKQLEVPLQEVGQTVPPPAQPEPQVEIPKASPAVPEAPKAPEPPAEDLAGDIVISKVDRDTLVAIVLEKEGVSKEQAQGAMREQLAKFGYAKTTDIKYRDYDAIVQWAKQWEPEL